MYCSNLINIALTYTLSLLIIIMYTKVIIMLVAKITKITTHNTLTFTLIIGYKRIIPILPYYNCYCIRYGMVWNETNNNYITFCSSLIIMVKVMPQKVLHHSSWCKCLELDWQLVLLIILIWQSKSVKFVFIKSIYYLWNKVIWRLILTKLSLFQQQHYFWNQFNN